MRFRALDQRSSLGKRAFRALHRLDDPITIQLPAAVPFTSLSGSTYSPVPAPASRPGSGPRRRGRRAAWVSLCAAQIPRNLGDLRASGSAPREAGQPDGRGSRYPGLAGSAQGVAVFELAIPAGTSVWGSSNLQEFVPVMAVQKSSRNASEESIAFPFLCGLAHIQDRARCTTLNRDAVFPVFRGYPSANLPITPLVSINAALSFWWIGRNWNECECYGALKKQLRWRKKSRPLSRKHERTIDGRKIRAFKPF